MSLCKVLVVGSNGQLGSELQKTIPERYQAIFLHRNELDISQKQDTLALIKKHQPDWIINAAAYTAVDQAEDDRNQAMQVNVVGSENLALAANEVDSRLITLSTDYVFDGTSNRAYLPSDKTGPLSVYGETKLAGEQAILRVLSGRAVIIRTSWVYAAHGHNFVKTLLRLCAEKEQLNIVSDQIGTPTWARSLARMIWLAVDKEISGVWHFTDAGIASWYDFAHAIQQIAVEQGLLNRAIEILPIQSEEYPQKARRPAFSVLDKSKSWNELNITPLHWRDALQQMMSEIKKDG